MKKLLAMALALVMALGLCSVSWADSDGASSGNLGEVYVGWSSGNDNNDGTAADKAVRTMTKAMELVKSDGTGVVYIVDTVPINQYFFGEANGDSYITKPVTLKGYGDNKLSVTNSLALPKVNGKVTFENFSFDGGATFNIYDSSNTYENLELVISNCNFTKAGGGCVYIQPKIKSLTVTGCAFTAEETGGYSGQYLIWPYAAKNITITNNTFDGKDRIRAAIHLGNGHPDGTTAIVENNSMIKGFERGVQVAFKNPNVQNTVTIDGNTFENISHKEGSSKGENEVAVIFLHENLAREGVKATVTVGLNNVMTNAPRMIYAEETVDAAKIVEAPAGSELVDNGDGTYSVKPAEQKPSNNYYYYSPSTTTTDTTKGSPKTFDAGVGIYAVTAMLSVTGMAWVGKKRH